MKKDIEWLKERVYKIIDYYDEDNFLNQHAKMMLEEIQNAVNQLDEPESLSSVPEQEKVKVPEFVGGWYEENKDDLDCQLYEFISEINELDPSDFEDIHDWLDQSRWNGEQHHPIETVIKMKLFGYEVEKEPLRWDYGGAVMRYKCYLKEISLKEALELMEDNRTVFYSYSVNKPIWTLAKDCLSAAIRNDAKFFTAESMLMEVAEE